MKRPKFRPSEGPGVGPSVRTRPTVSSPEARGRDVDVRTVLLPPGSRRVLRDVGYPNPIVLVHFREDLPRKPQERLVGDTGRWCRRQKHVSKNLIRSVVGRSVHNGVKGPSFGLRGVDMSYGRPDGGSHRVSPSASLVLAHSGTSSVGP